MTLYVYVMENSPMQIHNIYSQNIDWFFTAVRRFVFGLYMPTPFVNSFADINRIKNFKILSIKR